jgi:hypothetical protein
VYYTKIYCKNFDNSGMIFIGKDGNEQMGILEIIDFPKCDVTNINEQKNLENWDQLQKIVQLQEIYTQPIECKGSYLKTTSNMAGLPTLLLVILAIILPPIAVLLTDGVGL